MPDLSRKIVTSDKLPDEEIFYQELLTMVRNHMRRPDWVLENLDARFQSTGGHTNSAWKSFYFGVPHGKSTSREL